MAISLALAQRQGKSEAQVPNTKHFCTGGNENKPSSSRNPGGFAKAANDSDEWVGIGVRATRNINNKDDDLIPKAEMVDNNEQEEEEEDDDDGDEG